MSTAKVTSRNKNYTHSAKKYESVLADHNTCCLCGTKLEFTHKADYQNLTVQEEAFCPACSIKTKNNTHALQ